MPLGDLFKSKQELETEQKRQQKKELRDATRSCDRVQADLERQEKELEKEIKAAAAKNDRDLTKILATQLVKVRNQKTRAVGAKSKIGSISSHANAMQANNKIAQIMSNSASVMSKVNQQMQPEKLAMQMGEFQKETAKMEMGESAMNDMFDELFEEDDEEADSIMNQVLEEIGLESGAALAKLPTTSKVDTSTKEAAATSSKQGVKKTEKH
uniref:Charged multivesicular body protein 2b n=1 Tax=Aceria tosichella TaxID=561515 RepID=A0A6G1SI02_9ACAR